MIQSVFAIAQLIKVLRYSIETWNEFLQRNTWSPFATRGSPQNKMI
jgi:hypothetical protein